MTHATDPTFAQVLDERFSCRAFLPEPVEPQVLDRLFRLAQRTPSWCNTQPWQVHLVTGEARDELAAHLAAAVTSAPGTSDLPTPERYEGVYQERRRASGFALYESLGIAREDTAARGAQMLRNFEFFGAPHVAIVTSDRLQGTYGAIDCGGYVATLTHAATSLGLATCAQAALAMYSNAVREFLDLPEDRLIVCGISLGRADLDHPANGFRTERAAVEDAVTVVDRRPAQREEGAA